MRRSTLAAVVMPAVLALATAASRRPPVEQAYPIICRGGPGIALRLRVVDFSIVNRTNILNLDFARGSGGAAQGVAPGTCAWQDRAVSASEPATLCWEGVEYASLSVDAGRGTLGLYGISTPEGETRTSFSNAERIVARPVNPGDPTVLMYFRAQGGEVRGERCLRVVHSGP